MSETKCPWCGAEERGLALVLPNRKREWWCGSYVYFDGKEHQVDNCKVVQHGGIDAMAAELSKLREDNARLTAERDTARETLHVALATCAKAANVVNGAKILLTAYESPRPYTVQDGRRWLAEATEKYDSSPLPQCPGCERKYDSDFLSIEHTECATYPAEWRQEWCMSTALLAPELGEWSRLAREVVRLQGEIEALKGNG